MSRMDLHFYRRYATEVQDLGVDVQRFGAVRDIHEKLNNLLGDKRTFFDKHMYEEIKQVDPAELVFNEEIEEIKEEEVVPVPAPKQEVPQLTSLDIVAWAYLKEELINTPDSQEVKDLKAKYPNLVAFVNFMDTLFKNLENPFRKADNQLVWNHSPDNSQKIVGTL